MNSDATAIVGTPGLELKPADENYICVFPVCDQEGKLAKKLSPLMCLYHIKYYSCTKCKGSACTRGF